MEALQAKDLNNRFRYHAPTGGKADRHEKVRHACLILAGLIADESPTCREQSLAITHLEETMMWANAAIARRREVP